MGGGHDALGRSEEQIALRLINALSKAASICLCDQVSSAKAALGMHAYFDEPGLRRRLKIVLQTDRANMKVICNEIDCGEVSMFEFLEGESAFDNEVLRSLQNILATFERRKAVVGFGLQKLSDTPPARALN